MQERLKWGNCCRGAYSNGSLSNLPKKENARDGHAPIWEAVSTGFTMLSILFASTTTKERSIFGPLLETFVFSEMLKQTSWFG
jgi:hypothetical protein